MAIVKLDDRTDDHFDRYWASYADGARARIRSDDDDLVRKIMSRTHERWKRWVKVLEPALGIGVKREVVLVHRETAIKIGRAAIEDLQRAFERAMDEELLEIAASYGVEVVG